LSAVGTFKRRYDIHFYNKFSGWKLPHNVVVVYVLVHPATNSEPTIISKYFSTLLEIPETKNHNFL
jgi:hypothetical protein